MIVTTSSRSSASLQGGGQGRVSVMCKDRGTARCSTRPWRAPKCASGGAPKAAGVLVGGVDGDEGVAQRQRLLGVRHLLGQACRAPSRGGGSGRRGVGKGVVCGGVGAAAGGKRAPSRGQPPSAWLSPAPHPRPAPPTPSGRSVAPPLHSGQPGWACHWSAPVWWQPWKKKRTPTGAWGTSQ